MIDNSVRVMRLAWMVTAVLFASLLTLNGCSLKTEATEGNDCSQGQNCTGISTTNAQVDTNAASQPTIRRIAFIDLEESCACTRRRIEASWNALQSTLGAGSPVPIDRIHLDSQEALVQPYREQKPFQVIPAVYFMDANENVIEMLQGEIGEKQIGDVLKGKTS